MNTNTPDQQGTTVEKLVAPGQREAVDITADQRQEIEDVVHELNVAPFGEMEEDGPTPQDWLDTVQYNLNHASPEKLELSEKAIKFIRDSKLFLV
ncbi:hypothetical protein KKA33_02690 [Patescibacteria group bacterium]|nr:hypothetical protein [Patescibacteria group bacterium]